MPRALPKYCERFTDRHGKSRIYFRRGKGARIALPADPTSDAFIAAYSDALAGMVAERKKRPAPDAAGTLGALIVSYKSSPAYAALRLTTRTGYKTPLEALRTTHGQRTLAGMTRERINEKILQPYADRPGAGLFVLKMLRVLVRHGIDIGWLKADPTLGIRRPKGGEIRSWTDAEIGIYEHHHKAGTRERLAFALMLYTGQRRSDVHRMTWADVQGGTIRVIQQKTGAKLTIPLHAELRRTLDTAPREHMTILNTAYGQPFTVDGFSGFMRDAIKDAGLPLGCQPHGLRKAAGRRLAEAGCTAHEIMSILGHKSLAEAERYSREADQARLASAAIHKLEGRSANRNPQTGARQFGKTAKPKGTSI
jgi:integrase